MTHSARQRVQQVLVLTLLLNLIVALAKIVVGLLSGALAIVADGFHSLMDGAGNIVALVTNAIAARPPDEDHPYGHRRFETIGALVIGGLLLLTALEIVESVGERLFADAKPPTITALTLGLLLLTLVVNIAVSTYQRREGQRLRSEVLLADAANTRADVFVTLSVLGSSVFVLWGFAWMDTVAALVVVALIGRTAWDVLRGAGGVLVDTAPYTPEQLSAWVCDLPCDLCLVRARSRGTCHAAHIDIDVQLPAQTTLAQAATVTHTIRTGIVQRVRAAGGGVAEVEVHFSPGGASKV